MTAPYTVASGHGHISWIDDYGHEWHRALVRWRVDSLGETFEVNLTPGNHTITVPALDEHRIRRVRPHVINADGNTIKIGDWTLPFAPGDILTMTWGPVDDPGRKAVHQAVYDVLVDDPYHCDEPCCEFTPEREAEFGGLVDKVTDAAIAAMPRS